MKVSNKWMQKIKLIVTAAVFLLFALFAGLQISEDGTAGFATAFFVTLGVGVFIFLLQVEYYLFTSKWYIDKGFSKPQDFQNPLDIWLFAIPITVLMMFSYLLLNWHIVQVYYCTLIALTGMLFGNGLGRGCKRWSIKKSLPFFFGVALSTAYAFIMEGMM